MKSARLKLFGSVFVVLAIAAVFLPFIQSFGNQSIVHRSLSILHVRPNPHQGGMFGGGFFYTYNAFGCLPGLFNAFLSLVVFGLLFIRQLKKAVARMALAAAVLSHLLIFLNMVIAPFMLSDPDKLLIGYVLLTLAETGLFLLLFRHTEIPSRSFSNPDLLDEKPDSI